jgi:hypothetical protein
MSPPGLNLDSTLMRLRKSKWKFSIMELKQESVSSLNLFTDSERDGDDRWVQCIVQPEIKSGKNKSIRMLYKKGGDKSVFIGVTKKYRQEDGLHLGSSKHEWSLCLSNGNIWNKNEMKDFYSDIPIGTIITMTLKRDEGDLCFRINDSDEEKVAFNNVAELKTGDINFAVGMMK